MAGLYLIANCNFVPGKYDEWQAGFDDLAEYVFKAEPTTMTYYFGIPIDYSHDQSSTTMMFALEAYGKREDLYETHFKSPAMSSFLAKIPHIMTTGLDLTHYSLAAGFIDLPGDQRECGIMQDVKVLCLSANARQLVLAKAAKLAQAVESEGKDNGVFSFMVLSNLDVDKGVRLFLRFSSRDAMERHMRRKDVLDFWMTSKEDITTMESRGYVPNGKGWLHR